MPHAILTGEFELTIDAKNRLLIPSEVRKCLSPESDGNGFFLIVGVNKKPWLYTEKCYQTLVGKGEQDLLPDSAALAFDQVYYAMASKVDIDAQGRILIQDKVLRRTGTSREVTMIGVNNHLELWNRAEWETQFEKYLSEMPDLAKKAKEARSPQKSS